MQLVTQWWTRYPPPPTVADVFIILLEMFSRSILPYKLSPPPSEGTPRAGPLAWSWMPGTAWPTWCPSTRALPSPTPSCGWTWPGATSHATSACCSARRATTSTPRPSLRWSAPSKRYDPPPPLEGFSQGFLSGCARLSVDPWVDLNWFLLLCVF